MFAMEGKTPNEDRRASFNVKVLSDTAIVVNNRRRVWIGDNGNQNEITAVLGTSPWLFALPLILGWPLGRAKVSLERSIALFQKSVSCSDQHHQWPQGLEHQRRDMASWTMATISRILEGLGQQGDAERPEIKARTEDVGQRYLPDGKRLANRTPNLRSNGLSSCPEKQWPPTIPLS